ncbi:MAG: hypothetical protein HYW05_02430 [Candidatus Diapherotrites archaeon]|nr:hypothetical protein [Candidatus Diapherotrites archaeon]
MPPRYKTYRQGVRKSLESVEKARERAVFALHKNYTPGRDFERIIKTFEYEGLTYAKVADKTGKEIILMKRDEEFTGISEGRRNDIKKALRL